MRSGKMAYVPGVEKRNLLMIYTRLQEYLQWFSQELTQQEDSPKRVPIPLFIERRKTLQTMQIGSRMLRFGSNK